MTFEEAQKAIADGQIVQWQDRNSDWNDVDPKTSELIMARDIGSKLRIKMEESKMDMGMDFYKSKIYTALNADELKVGSKVIVADCLNTLRQYVEQRDNIVTLEKVNDETHLSRFFDGESSWCLAYLVSEPEEKKLKWTDLKVGDAITNGRHTAMVTDIDKRCEYNMHIYAGCKWLKDDELSEWEKVEDNDND